MRRFICALLCLFLFVPPVSAVTVCVIDSGCSADGVEVHAYTPNAEDEAGHGTEVCALIRGIAPEAEIIMLKCFDEALEEAEPLIVKAVRDAADVYGADIILTAWTCMGDSEALHGAVREAHEKGIAVIAPMGNIGPACSIFCDTYPAAWEEVIAVGGADEDGDGVFRGNLLYKTGPYMDVCAPAEGGTSFAAARVAGICAGYLEKHPEADGEALRAYLIESAEDLGEEGRDEVFGRGLVHP